MKNIFVFLLFLLISFKSYSNINDYEETFKDHFEKENIPKNLQKDFKFCAYYFFIERINKKAINYCEKLLKLSKNYYGPENDQVLELHFYLAELFWQDQNVKKSFEYIDYALPLTEKLYPENSYNIILGNWIASQAYIQKGSKNEAINKIEKLINLFNSEKYNDDFKSIFQTENINEIKVSLLTSILSAQTNNYDIKKADQILSDIKKILTSAELPDDLMVHVYNAYGNHHRVKFEGTLALKYYNKALSLLNLITEFDVNFHPILWSNISLVHTVNGDIEKALEFLKKAEKKTIDRLGPKASNLFILYHNIATNFMEIGNYNLTIEYFNKALEIAEYNQDFSDQAKIQTLINLGASYLNINNIDYAILIDEKLNKILDKRLDILYLDQYQNFKLQLLLAKNDYENLIDLSNKILKDIKKIYGNKNFKVFQQLTTLSDINFQIGNYQDAIKYGEEAIELSKIIKANTNLTYIYATHVILANCYISLWAENNFENKQYLNSAKNNATIAYNFFKLNKEDDRYITSLDILALIEHQNENFSKSLNYDLESLGIILKKIRISENSNFQIVSNIDIQKTYIGVLGSQLGRRLDLNLLDIDYVKEISFHEDTFKIAQLINASKTDQSLKKMSVRSSAGNKELEKVIYKRDQKQLLIDQLSLQLYNYKTLDISIRNLENEKKLSKKIKKLILDQNNLNQYIFNNYPGYVEISSNQILSINDVFGLLNNDEAILYFLTDFSATVVLLIKNDDIYFNRIDLTEEQLFKEIKVLRDSLDLSNVVSINNLLPFPVNKSKEMYKKLLGVFSNELSEINHLYIVPTGILHSLPYSTLIEDKNIENIKNYKEIPWLIKRFSVSILPSISGLKLLRLFSKNNLNTTLETFVGIGNPKFNNNNKNEKIEISFNKIFSKGVLADVNVINDFPLLPETEKEIKMLSRNFEKNNTRLLLGPLANEKKIKNMDLSNTDVIAFSTHAVINGEIDNDEPGLILTPPPKASIENDGILTMSEILELKLNADFVILSACNTASGENNKSEPLSGLARAFFFAGAKSLLVSNWAVESESATMITTTMFNNIKKGINKSESLRLSMISIINDDDKHFQHPVFWAPFMLIGDR